MRKGFPCRGFGLLVLIILAAPARGQMPAAGDPMRGEPSSLRYGPLGSPYSNPFLNPYLPVRPMDGGDLFVNFLAARQIAARSAAIERASTPRPATAEAPRVNRRMLMQPGGSMADVFFGRTTPSVLGRSQTRRYNRHGDYYRNWGQ